jgi:hypothetical protein
MEGSARHRSRRQRALIGRVERALAKQDRELHAESAISTASRSKVSHPTLSRTQWPQWRAILAPRSSASEPPGHFTTPTIHRCSNPGCVRPTSGPALDESKVIDVGEAAHITAAARGGKRFDESQTPEERSAENNGIWLCGLCAGLIDKDDLRYTVEVLRKWKQDAVDRALRDITTRTPGAYPAGAAVVEFDDEDRAFLRSLALPAEDEFETVVARMREAAARDIAASRAADEWPAHAIALNLTLRAADGRYSISLAGMANGVNVAEVLNLVSPPGTGKTTTMVQLAGAIHEAGHAVPALVPLGEWSDRPEDFFAFLARRNAFRAFRPQHFMQVAYCGRLTLLLDGWNELDPGSRIRALRDLRALRRDYPLLGIVIGTRRDLRPLSGPVVEIEALSEDQQLELARALRGTEGEALIDQAWRTPGVRELAGWTRSATRPCCTRTGRPDIRTPPTERLPSSQRPATPSCAGSCLATLWKSGTPRRRRTSTGASSAEAGREGRIRALLTGGLQATCPGSEARRSDASPAQLFD